ncbi:hypothetical protein GCM10009821_04050 [Aeromicrobium halocynthiae]|uniref:Integral membrane protein n=1 Tax=Aeromicrobium halocynthiae TaxID=560557 RepID=A0ABN2VRR5_9ACTN
MTNQDPPPGDDQNRPDDLPPGRPPSEMGPPLPPPPPDAVPPSTGGAAPPPGGVPPMGGYGAPPPGAQPPPPPPGTPTGPGGQPDIGAGFSWAWAKFQANAAPLVVSTLIIGALAVVAYLIVYLPLLAIVGGGGSEISVDPVTGEITGFSAGPGFFVTTLVSAIGLFALFIVIQGVGSNLVRMSLKIADGEEVAVGDLFTFPRGGSTFVTAILLALGTAVGYLLCFLPGIVFAWGAAFTFAFFYDKGLAPVDAIKASFTLFKDNLGPAILTVLLGGLVASAGVLLCFVGVIVSAPIAQLFIVHQYRSMTGGRITA